MTPKIAQYLSAKELDRVLASIPESFKQAHRLVSFLADNPSAITVAVNQSCAIGNISDVANKVNPYLFRHRLFIACKRPLEPVLNRFNEPSQMFEWSIYRVNEAANDEFFGIDSGQKVAE